ncbi:MAG: hypothetical protein JJU20_01715 [Opitutales bacterium]|nr:hypothetical protein [Opitutales bacterium]
MSKATPRFTPPSGIRTRLSLFGKALSKELKASGKPIATAYDIFQEMRALYASDRKLMLRKKLPDHDELDKVRRQLMDANVLDNDEDFKQNTYRIISNGDGSAEDVCCIADRFCFISHLSAMARYGLTDRRPHILQLTAPNPKILHKFVGETLQSDYGAETLLTLEEDQIVKPPARTKFPGKVRGREVSVMQSAHPGASQQLRGCFSRIGTIGQVFASMLEEPDLCGGMKHVLEIWQEHAQIYLDDIIEAIGSRPKGITKVRAGYILDELIGIEDPRIEQWTRHAQRGSSRLLNPSATYESKFSEKWMLSLNVN